MVSPENSGDQFQNILNFFQGPGKHNVIMEVMEVILQHHQPVLSAIRDSDLVLNDNSKYGLAFGYEAIRRYRGDHLIEDLKAFFTECIVGSTEERNLFPGIPRQYQETPIVEFLSGVETLVKIVRQQARQSMPLVRAAR